MISCSGHETLSLSLAHLWSYTDADRLVGRFAPHANTCQFVASFQPLQPKDKRMGGMLCFPVNIILNLAILHVLEVYNDSAFDSMEHH